MEILQVFRFSAASLLVFQFLPLGYFFVKQRFSYDAARLQRNNFITVCLSLLLGGATVAKLANTPGLGAEGLLLGLAHLMPVALTLLLISVSRPVYGSQPGAPRAVGATETAGNYSPTPLNREIEKLGWNDLVIDEKLKEELISIIELLRDPATAKRYGIESPKGILLDGPPGTGKTTVAKVIANTAQLSFFVLRLDEVISKWVGESEKNLSALFKAAQRHRPAVIFIDEVDSIGKSRSGSGSHQWAENLLNHLLQLVDGVIKTEGLYIIAATNRADLVDPALKRSGRLTRTIEIPLPNREARRKLFELYLSKLTLGERVHLDALAEVTDGKSCADIHEICNQAGLNAFKRESASGRRTYTVTNLDIENALNDLG